MNKWVVEEALRRDAAWANARARAVTPAARPPAKAVFKQQFRSEVRSVDEKTRTIWHKITVEERDRIGDIIRIDGIDTAAFSRKPAVLYGHDYRSMNPVPVVGENVGFMREGNALYAGTKFLGPDEVSRPLADLVGDLWTLNKKKLMGWSVGFMAREAKDIVEGGRVTGQDYVRSELLEYSNVIIPANAEAVNDAIARGLVSKTLMGYGSKSAPEGPVFFYRVVDEHRIDEHKVLSAVRMLEWCMYKLKIPKVDLAWFEVCDAGAAGAKVLGPRRTKGFAIIGGGKDPVVHLRSDLSHFDIGFAAAHEAHHVWMEAQPPARFELLGADDRENSANAFAWISIDALDWGRGCRA